MSKFLSAIQTLWYKYVDLGKIKSANKSFFLTDDFRSPLKRRTIFNRSIVVFTHNELLPLLASSLRYTSWRAKLIGLSLIVVNKVENVWKERESGFIVQAVQRSKE